MVSELRKFLPLSEISLKEMKERSELLSTTPINFDGDLPTERKLYLIYEAYKVRGLPVPDHGRSPRYGAQRGDLSVNFTSNRKSHSHTNFNAIAANGAPYYGGYFRGKTNYRRDKASFLCTYEPNLTSYEFATLFQYRDLRSFRVLSKKLNPDSFLEHLKNVCRCILATAGRGENETCYIQCGIRRITVYG